MSETPTDWKIHFTLSEKIDCVDTLPTIENFEIEIGTGKAEQKSITGFNINVENATETIAKETASKKAQIFTDLLSITSGTASMPRRDGTSRLNESGRHTVSRTFTFMYNIRNNADLDISQSRLNEILENRDTELSQKMRYVNRAIDAIANRNPASAIKELFLVCDEDPQGSLAKYKSLRNALSHEPVYPNDIQNIQRDFGTNYFEFTLEGRFDYISNQNLENLTTEANSFLKQVRENIKNRI